MVNVICKEAEMRSGYLNGEVIETVYLGGGTPSLLSRAELDQLLTCISTNFTISHSPEITLEANPDDLGRQQLEDLFATGVNRLSVGIQTFDDQLLTFLNRAHNSRQALDSFYFAREAGFENISIDLIFSIPGQKIRHLNDDLRRIVSLNPEHISIYGLTIEENTVFGNWHKKGRLITIAEEDAAAQFDMLMDQLDRMHYEQYEISNFCRAGHYSAHNSSYWLDIPYLGIGPGAHSYNGTTRQFNIAQNHMYMKSIERGELPCVADRADKKARANDYLLSSLRTKWGCDLQRLKAKFGYHLQKERERQLTKYVDQQMVTLDRDVLLLTRSGRFIADSITGDLFWD